MLAKALNYHESYFVFFIAVDIESFASNWITKKHNNLNMGTEKNVKKKWRTYSSFPCQIPSPPSSGSDRSTSIDQESKKS